MEESFPMTGGDGQYSYAKNSNPQKEAAERAKPLVISAIVENLGIENQSPATNYFRIADLGCSTGPNTFIAINNIIEAVTQKYKIKGHSSLPEFQVFFNDHFSNDFNVLFANLPIDRQYFALGVPGSFHGRLFPNGSLDFVYSSYSLQWLSRVPQELGQLNSPSCNKGRIFYTNAPNEVGQAYVAQYAKDIESFLGCRAHELAAGGLMALLIPGRPDGTLPAQASIGPFFQPLESCLVDMASEGIISNDKLDSFNLPLYCPSAEELRTLIQNNGCFDIARLDTQPQRVSPLLKTQECRAGIESLMLKHFGSDIIEEIFQRYGKKIAGRPPLGPSDGTGIGLFVLLKRKHFIKNASPLS